MPPVLLRSPDASIRIDPALGGRLVSWVVGDLELLGGRSDVPEEYGCYPMAPWAGRVRDNHLRWAGAEHDLPATYCGWAMHGTVLAKCWDVVEVSDAHVALVTELGPTWPWRGRAHLTWQLDAASLRSTLAVSSDGPSFPAEVGWHPWFRRRLERGAELSWSMRATAMLERGPDHLPTGRTVSPPPAQGPFDDAFAVADGRVEIRWPGVLTVTCQSDVAWVVIYDELDDLVCIEPQSGPPDGLGRSTPVTPGSPRSASVSWTWATDPPR